MDITAVVRSIAQRAQAHGSAYPAQVAYRERKRLFEEARLAGAFHGSAPQRAGHSAPVIATIVKQPAVVAARHHVFLPTPDMIIMADICKIADRANHPVSASQVSAAVAAWKGKPVQPLTEIEVDEAVKIIKQCELLADDPSNAAISCILPSPVKALVAYTVCSVVTSLTRSSTASREYGVGEFVQIWRVPDDADAPTGYTDSVITSRSSISGQSPPSYLYTIRMTGDGVTRFGVTPDQLRTPPRLRSEPSNPPQSAPAPAQADSMLSVSSHAQQTQMIIDVFLRDYGSCTRVRLTLPPHALFSGHNLAAARGDWSEVMPLLVPSEHDVLEVVILTDISGNMWCSYSSLEFHDVSPDMQLTSRNMVDLMREYCLEYDADGSKFIGAGMRGVMGGQRAKDPIVNILPIRGENESINHRSLSAAYYAMPQSQQGELLLHMKQVVASLQEEWMVRLRKHSSILAAAETNRAIIKLDPKWHLVDFIMKKEVTINADASTFSKGAHHDGENVNLFTEIYWVPPEVRGVAAWDGVFIKLSSMTYTMRSAGVVTGINPHFSHGTPPSTTWCPPGAVNTGSHGLIAFTARRLLRFAGRTADRMGF